MLGPAACALSGCQWLVLWFVFMPFYLFVISCLSGFVLFIPSESISVVLCAIVAVFGVCAVLWRG